MDNYSAARSHGWCIILLTIWIGCVDSFVPRFAAKLKYDHGVYAATPINDEKTVKFLSWAESEGI